MCDWWKGTTAPGHSWYWCYMILLILVARSEQETHQACQVHLMFRTIMFVFVCSFFKSLWLLAMTGGLFNSKHLQTMAQHSIYMNIAELYIFFWVLEDQNPNLSNRASCSIPCFRAGMPPLPPGGCCVQSWQRNSPGRGAAEGTAGWSWSKSSRCRRAGDVCIYHHIIYHRIYISKDSYKL